jgi:hypothetical protein
VARVDFCVGCSRPCINQIVATRLHVLHAIDATPDRWRAPGGLSSLNSVHPTHWLIYAQAAARAGGATSCGEIAQIRTANEFCIYSASVAFLLVSMVTRDRYKDVVLISAPFLVAVAVATGQAKTTSYGVVETELP